MTEPALVDALMPAYAPCEGFNGSCAGVCVWEPDRGVVPCAFGGAKGALSEVRLVIVTAEPSDPPDDCVYRGNPREMVARSLAIFERSMRSGDLGRSGRPTQFHRRMRRILDLFWPNLDLDDQLRRTWTTNAVLCPAPVIAGAHPPRVEQACAARFLAPQLALLPQAFILALGGKAARRIRKAGLHIDATAPHPSARLSLDAMDAAWAVAAARFRGETSGATSRPQPAVAGKTARTITRAIPPKNLEPTVRTAAMIDAVASDIAAQPPQVADLFADLHADPRFSIVSKVEQLQVWHAGLRVGGWNKKKNHFYVLRPFEKKFDGAAALRRHGFFEKRESSGHTYWRFDGYEGAAAFRAALAEMTRESN